MNLDKKAVRAIGALILFGVVANAAIQNLAAVQHAFDVLLGVISPVLLGFVIAFLLNIAVNLLEKRLIKPRGKRALALQARLQRPVSILLSLVLILIILVSLSSIIAPRLVAALSTLFMRLPGWVDALKLQLRNFEDTAPELIAWVESLSIDWAGMQNSVINFLQKGVGNALSSAVSVASSVFGTATSTVLAFIIALSIVARKERLAAQLQNVVRAFVPPDVAERAISITRQTGRAFSGFITGQLLEACILGMLVFLGMLIFRFPHALLISALVAVTAVIPIFGAFVSAGVGALLILVTNRFGQALGFVAFFIILQQLEGNLIYPRVMGSNVGLPALWVLVAITVGGGALGILGMLISVPIFAVAYNLTRDAVRARRGRTQAKSEGSPS